MNKFGNDKSPIEQLLQAVKNGNVEDAKSAGNDFFNAVIDEVRQEVQVMQESNDSVILAQRGHRQLTSTETKWYQKVIDAMKAGDPRQAFIAAVNDDTMPQTIIEDVYKNLREEHPLLGAINFQYVGYLTKWILNDHATQKAIWGTITAEIAKEITSAFKVIDLKQSKLSAYAIIEQGMLDLGPKFLDKYIRQVLSEALLEGLEEAIVNGTGVNQPIGLIKDIHKGGSFNSETGYPDKEKVAVTSFAPKEYGELASKLAMTENKKMRTLGTLGLICNQTDYLTKVMPATTLLVNGEYQKDLFPVATKVYINNSLKSGEAVLFIPEEYFLGMGGEKNGIIEYSDEYKFIEDQRVFKIKQYGAGRPFDNTSSLFLDISGLKELYLTVESITVPAV